MVRGQVLRVVERSFPWLVVDLVEAAGVEVAADAIGGDWKALEGCHVAVERALSAAVIRGDGAWAGQLETTFMSFLSVLFRRRERTLRPSGYNMVVRAVRRDSAAVQWQGAVEAGRLWDSAVVMTSLATDLLQGTGGTWVLAAANKSQQQQGSSSSSKGGRVGRADRGEKRRGMVWIRMTSFATDF